MKQCLIILSAVLACRSVQVASAQNFSCRDAEIQIKAEQSRTQSALFWTGKEVQADWKFPCPIDVRWESHTGGGRTQFRFVGQDVTDADMLVSGTRAAIIEDVIPHEVDHLVRANFIGHPIERWLDEGCATLFESEQSKERLRKLASRVDSEVITSRFLNASEYPGNSTKLSELYAVGFSLVEHLLKQESPPVLLAFQKANGDVEERLRKYYGIGVSELRESWRLRTSLRCECSSQPTKPLLVVWTSTWCPPCKQFLNDWNGDREFQATLRARFHIHFLDFDRHLSLAQNHGVKNVPSFETSSGVVVGYASKAELLSRLGVTSSHEIRTDDVPSTADAETEVSATPQNIEELIKTEKSSPNTSVENDDSHLSEEQSVTDSTEDRDSPRWKALQIGLTTLQWAGLIGGSAATGGLAGVAISILPRLIVARRKRRRDKHDNELQSPQEVGPQKTPFPRHLDEARQLLELRQSEGRVAILDALRGMFLDDEVQKLKQTNPSTEATLTSLIQSVDERVDEVAPLST